MTIQAVHRAIDILNLFSTSRPRLGITEMSNELGLPKATVQGLVNTLMERGFLTRDNETRKYGLGLGIFELGTLLAASLKINQVGAGPAQRLSTSVERAVRLAIWDNQTVLVTMNFFPGIQKAVIHQLGPRVMAYCTAIGKSILAFLPKEELDDFITNVNFQKCTPNTIVTKKDLLEDLARARARGYAEDREEYLMGLACISTPVFDFTGKPVGSISISGNTEQIFGGGVERLAAELLATADEISLGLGYRPEVKPMGRTR